MPAIAPQTTPSERLKSGSATSAAANVPLPPSRASSFKSMTASQKEARQDVGTDFFTAKGLPTHAAGGHEMGHDAMSMNSVTSSIGTLATEPAPWTPPKPVNVMTAANFGQQVSQLAAQTKIARNVMPMIVRGGVIASLGMFLFGHLAPMAIIAVMVGAVVGGYAIAKFMQMRQAKQFAAMGENNPLALLQKNMPQDASEADKAKLQSIVNFVEKGDIFGNGMLKTFQEPYRAIKNKIAAKNAPPMTPTAPEPDAQSTKSNLSEAQQVKANYENGKA